MIPAPKLYKYIYKRTSNCYAVEYYLGWRHPTGMYELIESDFFIVIPALHGCDLIIEEVDEFVDEVEETLLNAAVAVAKESANESTKCECGAESLGVSMHSDWCPKFKS